MVKLIKELNQQMQAEGSNEKITIIGPSMGGLISRYALAWMEKNGQTHNCKLWASFDSPHHGANIMLGDQLLLDYLGNGLGIGSAKKSVKEQLDSPAARQMLISHYRGYNSSSLTAGGALEFRDRFVGEMNDIGFPTNSCLRKIALINGSKNATFASTPCNHSLGMQAILQSFGTQVVTALFGPVANALASLKADVYTEPSTGATCKVLEREFGLGTFYKKWEINNNSFRQTSLDILPGGYYDVSGDIADQGRDKNWFYQVQFQNFFPKASFIPSVSGLALKNINRNWAENLSNINVIADTPFDAIYAPINENQNHVSLTSENVQFVKDQLNLANQQCTSGGGGCIVNKVRFVFRPDCCQDRLNGSKIQGSNDGNTWSDLYTISSNGTGSWQEFTFGNTTSYSSVRFQASGNGHGELVELEFYNNSTKLNGTAFATGGTWDNNTVVYGYQNAFDGNASGNMWHAANSGTNATAGLTLSGCGGCNLAAPTLSASPVTINSGQSSSLSASNCGGTVNWSTGATGSNRTVSPTQTTTYTATCTVGSCTSGNGSITVTVNGSGGSSNCSAESIECSGNQYEVRNYSVTASNATVHTIKVQYRSHEGPGVIRWSVNGGSVQTLNVSQTGINDYVEITLGTAFLNAGTNTFSLSSGAAYLCFKKVCIQSGGRIGVAEEEEVTGKDAQTLQLYPNPTDGKVTVRYELKKGQKANLQFMNAKGQVLLQKGLVGEGGWGQSQTDLSAQPEGSYVVRMETREKTVSRKFVIAK